MSEEKKISSLAFHYIWKLNNVVTEFQPTTVFLSQMVKFQNEKIFRVGLNKTSPTHPTLLFMATNLNKMGLKVVDVISLTRLRLSDDSEKRQLERMRIQPYNHNAAKSGVQLFTLQLESSLPLGKQFIFFDIYISGIVDGYQIQRTDSHINEQLWSSVKNGVESDFVFFAGGKRFPVHKFILAARSPVFAALFSSDMLDTEKDTSAGSLIPREKTELVDAASMEQFLKFVYTGKLEGYISGRQLKQLATTYQIRTLENLCESASYDIDGEEMSILAFQLNPSLEKVSYEISLDDPSFDIEFSSNAGVLSLTWELKRTEAMESKTFEDENGKLFRVQSRIREYPSAVKTSLPLITYEIDLILFSFNNKKNKSSISEIGYFILPEDYSSFSRYRFEPKKLNEIPLTNDEEVLQKFTASDSYTFSPRAIAFHIHLITTLPSYDYALVDFNWKNELWAAAANRKFTDVEFHVGEETFGAHRSLLSARSPVFAGMFSCGMEEARTGRVRIEDVDSATFREFLQFLYTGMLEPSASKENLFVIADKYRVETLIEICKGVVEPVDVEKITEALLTC